MSNLYRAAGVLLTLRRNVGSMGKFWCGETPKEAKNLVCSYVRGVPAPEQRDPHDSKFIVGMSRSLVFHIGYEGYVAKISDPIVALDSVDVVDHSNRKTSVNIQPRESVGLEYSAAYCDAGVSSRISICSSNASFASASSSVNAPRKYSGFWVVVQKFAQAFCCNIGRSHDAPYQQIGQRSGSAETRPVLDILSLKAA